MQQLDNRVAIVTGASKGIGNGIARAFAAAGAKVVMASRTKADIEAAANEIAGEGRAALGIAANVAIEADVLRLFKATMDRHGRLDILVNNAGIMHRAAVDQIALPDWQRMLDTNLTGPFLCCREALKIMKAQKSGRIINIGSISAITPKQDTSPYVATKLALEGLTRSIALEYRDYNIGASIIRLGASATSWMKLPPEKSVGPEARLALEDIGRLAVFMASLPPDANVFETTIMPIQQRSFIGRG